MKNKGPLFIVPWRCTFACDSNCVHCTSAGKPAVTDEVDTAGAIKIVDEVHDFGASFFGITGGQPFLRKDLFEVIAYATKTWFEHKHHNRWALNGSKNHSKTLLKMKSKFP